MNTKKYKLNQKQIIQSVIKKKIKHYLYITTEITIFQLWNETRNKKTNIEAKCLKDNKQEPLYK